MWKPVRYRIRLLSSLGHMLRIFRRTVPRLSSSNRVLYLTKKKKKNGVRIVWRSLPFYQINYNYINHWKTKLECGELSNFDVSRTKIIAYLDHDLTLTSSINLQHSVYTYRRLKTKFCRISNFYVWDQQTCSNFATFPNIFHNKLATTILTL